MGRAVTLSLPAGSQGEAGQPSPAHLLAGTQSLQESADAEAGPGHCPPGAQRGRQDSVLPERSGIPGGHGGQPGRQGHRYGRVWEGSQVWKGLRCVRVQVWVRSGKGSGMRRVSGVGRDGSACSVLGRGSTQILCRLGTHRHTNPGLICAPWGGSQAVGVAASATVPVPASTDLLL